MGLFDGPFGRRRASVLPQSTWAEALGPRTPCAWSFDAAAAMSALRPRIVHGLPTDKNPPFDPESDGARA